VDCQDLCWKSFHQTKFKSNYTKQTIHQAAGKMVDAILKGSAIEKSYDNVTVVKIVFKNLLKYFESKENGDKTVVKEDIQDNES
jgi:hypothetical protein